MAYLDYIPQNTLYHYTSVSAFRSIISNGRLWLTDIKKTNDPRELQLGYDRVVKAIRQIRHGPDYVGERGFFLSILAGELTVAFEKFGIFGVCFSQLPDSMPLWRAYAGNGSGLTIGFRPRAIVDMPGRLQKVRYAVAEVDAELENLISISVARVDHKMLQEFSKEDWLHMTLNLFGASTSLKHESWAYEREVRLLFAHIVNSDDIRVDNVPFDSDVYGSGFGSGAPKSFQGRGGETDYFDFPFGKYSYEIIDNARAIEKVIIGDNCKLCLEEVNDEMRDHGYRDFTVAKSDCIFR